MDGRLQLRSEIVAFLELPPTGTATEPTYQRMQGFTTLSTSKNPRSYARQYVDEQQEQTDVVGYSPSMAFGMDQYVGNEVQDYIIEIISNEIVGTAAVVNIVMVDMVIDGTSADNAWIRPFAIIADTEGNSLDAYTYSGTFAVKGNKTWGRAVVEPDGLTLTSWTPNQP